MYYTISILLISAQICLGEFKSPPVTDNKPLLLDSFIPASMQIIAHITELMKFDLKPSTGSTTTTTTTMRPTKSHKPAIFAPDSPPGPEAYFTKGISYEEYVERLKYPNGGNYFDRYKYPVEEDEIVGRSLNIPQNIDLVLGKGLSDLLKLVMRVEDVSDLVDEDNQIQEFSRNYDDSDFRYILLRQKKQPPTRAYVTLLSLYDFLNKESKKLSLNKYNGYTENILRELVEISKSTSANQLHSVLKRISERKDTKNPQILKRIDTLVKDLENSNSYINVALINIPPLPFVL